MNENNDLLEGEVVTVVGKLDTRVKDAKDRVGTFWTYVAEKKALVLLPNGDIYHGESYNLVLGELK